MKKWQANDFDKVRTVKLMIDYSDEIEKIITNDVGVIKSAQHDVRLILAELNRTHSDRKFNMEFVDAKLYMITSEKVADKANLSMEDYGNKIKAINKKAIHKMEELKKSGVVVDFS